MFWASCARNVTFVFLKVGPSSTLSFRSTPFSLGWFKATKNLQSLKVSPFSLLSGKQECIIMLILEIN